MKCEQAKELLIEALSGQLDAAGEAGLERHLAGCARCDEEASGLRETWRAMAALDDGRVPSDRMRIRFRAALGAYEAHLERSWASRLARGTRRLQSRLSDAGSWAPAAAAAALLLVGITIGWSANQLLGTGRGLGRLRAEMAAMNRAVTLALLDHQSASERLRGVSWSAGIEPDDGVLAALIEVAQRDASVSVRLAAVEALGAHLERPDVRSGLLASLEARPGPQLQMAVTRLFAAEGARYGGELERLLSSDLLDPEVRRLLIEDRSPES